MRISDWSSDVCSSDLHPLGKAPVIVDTDADDRVVAETGAILEYLVEKGDGRLGTPAHRESALRYRHFLHYAEGSLMPPLLVKLVLGSVPVLGKPAQRRLQSMNDVKLDYVEDDDRRSLVSVKCVSVRVDLGGRRIHKKT